MEVGTTNGVITHIDAKFKLSVQPNAKIQVSFIGYITQTVTVGSQKNIKVTLKEDAQALDEVVVVGYGVQKKSDVTGSVGSVNSDKIMAKGTTSVMESLQGSVAGVDISQSSSRTGEGFNIAIRGKSSMAGGRYRKNRHLERCFLYRYLWLTRNKRRCDDYN